MSPSSLPSTLPTSSSPSHAPPPPPFLPFARAVPVALRSSRAAPRPTPSPSPAPPPSSPSLVVVVEVDVVLPRPPELPSCPRQWKLHMSLLTSPREMQPLRRNQHAPLVLEVTEQLNDLSKQFHCPAGHTDFLNAQEMGVLAPGVCRSQISCCISAQVNKFFMPPVA